MTLTESVQRQQRFYCQSCKHELFLLAKYCDSCGGKIDWPKNVQKIISSWKKK